MDNNTSEFSRPYAISLAKPQGHLSLLDLDLTLNPFEQRTTVFMRYDNLYTMLAPEYFDKDLILANTYDSVAPRQTMYMLFFNQESRTLHARQIYLLMANELNENNEIFTLHVHNALRPRPHPTWIKQIHADTLLLPQITSIDTFIIDYIPNYYYVDNYRRTFVPPTLTRELDPDLVHLEPYTNYDSISLLFPDPHHATLVIRAEFFNLLETLQSDNDLLHDPTIPTVYNVTSPHITEDLHDTDEDTDRAETTSSTDESTYSFDTTGLTRREYNSLLAPEVNTAISDEIFGFLISAQSCAYNVPRTIKKLFKMTRTLSSERLTYAPRIVTREHIPGWLDDDSTLFAPLPVYSQSHNYNFEIYLKWLIYLHRPDQIRAFQNRTTHTCEYPGTCLLNQMLTHGYEHNNSEEVIPVLTQAGKNYAEQILRVDRHPYAYIDFMHNVHCIEAVHWLTSQQVLQRAYQRA
jgi:hypothetical protein